MKFKVGDEVVVVCASFDNDYEIGWFGIVDKIETSVSPVIVRIDQKCPEVYTSIPLYGYKEDDLVLSSVFYSPLYQALK